MLLAVPCAQGGCRGDEDGAACAPVRGATTHAFRVCDVSVWGRAVEALSDAQREEIARLERLLGAAGVDVGAVGK